MLRRSSQRFWFSPVWRASCLGIAALWIARGSMLTPMATAVAGDLPLPPLPQPVAYGDPRWQQYLPPATLPLPKPAALSERIEAADKTTIAPTEAAPHERPPAATDAIADAVRREETALPVAMPVPLDREPAAAMTREAPDRSVAAGKPSEVPPNRAPQSQYPDSMARETAAAPPTTPVDRLPAASSENTQTTARYRWQVQLLAGRSLEKVRADRRILMKRHAALLEGLTLTIAQSPIGKTREVFYQLRALEWMHERDADQWCARFRAAGGQCFVIRAMRPNP